MFTTRILLKQLVATGLCAALTLGGTTPALARNHGGGGASTRHARQAPVQSAPRETFMQPAQRQPHVMRSAPRETFARSAPRQQHIVRSAPRETFVRSAPRQQHIVRSAPRETFVRSAPRAHAANVAPFIQYVHAPAPRRARAVSAREIVRSPLIRSMAAPRVRTAVAYHPAYLVGRVVSIRRDRIVLDPPVGTPILVRDVVVANPAAFAPIGSYVTLPVTFANGYYSLYSQPTYNGYAYASPAYCYGPSSTLYAALIPAVIGALSGNSSNFNTGDLATLALTAAAGSNSCSAYDTSYVAPVAYAAPVTYVTPVTYAYNTYATPYDSCVWSDVGSDGGSNCIAPQTTAYAYSPYAAYAPQQLQGLVVAKTGTMLMVLGANGMQPIFVNAAPAFDNGSAFNGPVAVGQVIDAIGYYNGDTFVATALE